MFRTATIRWAVALMSILTAATAGAQGRSGGEGKMEGVEHRVREQVGSALREAAKAAGVTTQENNFIFLSNAEVTVVNAAVEGSFTLRAEDAAKDGTIALVYLSRKGPKGEQEWARGIPSGWYKVQSRITITGQRGEGTVNLVDDQGKTIATAPATFEGSSPGKAKTEVTISIDWNDKGLALDITIALGRFVFVPTSAVASRR